MNLKNIFKLIACILILIILPAIFTYFSYTISNFIFYLLGKRTEGFLFQLLNSVINLIFLLILIVAFIYFLNIKIKDYIALINKAIQSISKGEYNIRLKNKFVDDENFYELVENINDMSTNLDKMEKMRQEFISNVSHEIKSPLTSIKGFAQILKSKNISEEKRLEYLNIIELESSRLSKLSENLLKLTTLESDSNGFECIEYRLDTQIKDVVLALELQWIDKNINMELNLEKVNILADKELLSQVWINLIQNSIKFTQSGGEISLSLINKNDKVEFYIKDNGPGIPKDELVHIFERFYKVDKARDRSIGGSGLGLSIVKKIIDLHNAKISVSSDLGYGTMFKIEL